VPSRSTFVPRKEINGYVNRPYYIAPDGEVGLQAREANRPAGVSYFWNPVALTVANVAPAPSAGPLTAMAVLVATAERQG
jgi:hypothetical protein